MQEKTTIPSYSESEAAIRQTIERMITGMQNKSGAEFASAFAEIHDYVVINGMLLVNTTRSANAQVHQELFSGTRQGALGADLSKLDNLQTEVRNIRFLTSEIAVTHLVSKIGGKDTTIASAVLRQLAGEWLIVAYHNAPVMGWGGPPPSA